MQASILIYLFAAAITRRLTQEVQAVSVARVMLLKYVLSDPGCLAGAEQRGSAGWFPLALSRQTRLQSFISITAAQRQSESE